MSAVGKPEKIGDAPIDPRHREQMQAIAEVLDDTFNGELRGKDRKVGFVLLVFPFTGNQGRANYISNAERKDIVVLLKEQLARFEGQPEMKGTA